MRAQPDKLDSPSPRIPLAPQIEGVDCDRVLTCARKETSGVEMREVGEAVISYLRVRQNRGESSTTKIGLKMPW